MAGRKADAEGPERLGVAGVAGGRGTEDGVGKGGHWDSFWWIYLPFGPLWALTSR